jgi:hypothetical protein
MSAELDKLDEINMRMIRTESRLVQLGDYVGANLRTKMRVDVRYHEGVPYVEVDALDVSASRIVTALREAGVRSGDILVYLNSKVIATVYPAAVPQWGDPA